MTMLPFGHTVIHKPQPLHRSAFIMILPAIFSYYLYKTQNTGNSIKSQILTDLHMTVKVKYSCLKIVTFLFYQSSSHLKS